MTVIVATASPNHRHPTAEAATPAFPLRVAAIDVGSNAIRFCVAEFTGALDSRMLATERASVRLGHDVFLTGRLTTTAMDAAAAAIAGFRDIMRAHGAEVFKAVATSAVREAGNGDEFVARVASECGITLEPISGAEEARLVHLAVKHRIPLGSDRWVLVDLGGGSVEVSLVDDSGILWSESHTIGSVRLLEELSHAAAEPGRFTELLAEYVATLRVPSAAWHGRVAGFIATGGNMETLARLANPGTGEEGTRVPLSRLRAVIQKLSRLSYRERVDELGLREDRADVILPAALVYERLCALAGQEEIHVPFVGLREGVLLDLVEEVTAHTAHRDRQEREVLSAAVNLGRHYLFDERHSVQVARLAGSLFDQLVALHGLGQEARKLLLAAAVLHDIGQFVSYKRHHKHSQYLISNSELAGFTARQMLLVATIARYHRKGEPSASHEEYADLTADERVTVDKLSAILRMADALDREHLQRVRSVRATVKGGELALAIDGDGEQLLEKWALQKKCGMFADLFKVKVRLA